MALSCKPNVRHDSCTELRHAAGSSSLAYTPPFAPTSTTFRARTQHPAVAQAKTRIRTTVYPVPVSYNLPQTLAHLAHGVC